MQQLVIVNGSASDQNRIITLATTWKSISTRHISREIFVKESAELMAMVIKLKPANVMTSIAILFSRDIKCVLREKWMWQIC